MYYSPPVAPKKTHPRCVEKEVNVGEGSAVVEVF